MKEYCKTCEQDREMVYKKIGNVNEKYTAYQVLCSTCLDNKNK